MSVQQSPTNMSKLMFRIVQCTGEESDYPVNELLTQSPQSKGWQSPRYCEYPQEITLQFLNSVRIKQVQFLSHQCKIPTKIELYVYAIDPQQQSNNREIKYKKLGYLSLDSNERSQYQARELKSVYIDTPCLYLKLVLHKCHLNKYNLFNQIGLIALSVFGEQANPQLQQKQPKEYFNEIQYETQMDANTLEKMRQLERAKEQAVKNEDFLEAKRLKESIDKLKQIGSQLRQLEERKAIAIQNEDYDSANIIKKEIDKLRNTIAPPDLNKAYKQQLAPFNQYQQYQEQEYDNQQNAPLPQQYDQYYDQQQQQPPSQQRGTQSRGMGQQYPPSHMLPVQQPAQKSFQQQVDQEYNEDERPIHPSVQNNYEEEQKIEEPKQSQKKRPTKVNPLPNNNQNQNFDEEVIPTAKNNKINQNQGEYENDNNQAEQNLKIDNLTGENMKHAEPLIPILGERCARMLFSKSWNTKEEGLKWLETQVVRPTEVNSSDPINLFTAMMGAVSVTINDRIAAVQAKSISLLQAILAKYNKLKIQKRVDFNEFTDSTIQGLMEKLGDNNARIKEQAESSMMMLADHQAIGSALCVNHLVKGITAKPKLESSLKHIIGRLNMITEYVKKFEINNPAMPYQQVVDFAIKQVDHNNEQVRTSAIFLLVEVYKCVGDKLRQSLLNVRPAQMEILEKFFSEIKGGGTGEKAMEEQKMIVSTNIEAQGQGSNKQATKKTTTKEAPQAKGKQPTKEEPIDQTTICEFCDKFDKNFKDSSKHDIHLWRECPMLLTCTQCAQVVEISGYTSHLLEECEQYKSFKKCPRCREAIHIQNYDNHVQEKSCLSAKPPAQANRCPLCHMDIKPNLAGWKQHLVQNGCPNNERTAG